MVCMVFMDIFVADAAFQASTRFHSTDVGDLHSERPSESATERADFWAFAAITAALTIFA
jgi:hypothetical protein